MKRNAYAKVNLTLDVTGRDARGYHLLSSVFAEISLCDTVSLFVEGDGLRLECDRPSVPADGTNLCCKAASAFFAETGIAPEGLRIVLEKRIPDCAGLGGGSSDAAAVLSLLCERHGIDPHSQPVLDAALRVGADVPFFLYGGVCHAQGVGELLTPLPPVTGYTLLVAKTEEKASTPQIFSLYDREARSFPLRTPAFLHALRTGADIAPFVSNHLTQATQTLCPSVQRLRDEMLSLGASAAEMSGSGSAVYGLFSSETAALLAKNRIDAPFCEVCRFVDIKSKF